MSAEDAAIAAFATARRLAKRSRVLRFEVAPLDMGDDDFIDDKGTLLKNLGLVRRALVDAARVAGAKIDTDYDGAQLWDELYKLDRTEGLADRLTTALTNHAEAGYIYGFAVGLLIAKVDVP